ncbi:MAG TPA: NrfD/PsrC family molybdoenzyme membrane anchor subunit [Patescibacteria group bacterium]|nr:NrfD/PsrC family molybdoenzyme membrane anchor subunit [Patescibacteria group bacterium]
MTELAELVGLKESIRRIPRRSHRSATGVLVGFLAVGLLTFLLGIFAEQPVRVWEIYLVNFLFWTGLAQAGVVFAAIYDLCNARWGHVIKRVAIGMGSFLPVALLMYVPLFFGRYWLFPWVRHPIPEKAAWLNVPLFFFRNGLGLAVMVALSLLYLYYNLRPQIGRALEHSLIPATPLYTWLTRGWQEFEAEAQRSRRTLGVLGPAILVAYAVVFSLLGFDLIMTLDPYWYSSLFGGYFFMSSLYLGIAGIAVITIILRMTLGLEQWITASHFHDLGKLLFGFDMLVIGLLWAQYIVIWYGNITEETQYVILRTQVLPWALFSWVALIAGFLGPLIVFFSRRAKQDPFALLPMGLAIAGGIWVERYVLVVPALWKGPAAPMGIPELLISAGFASAAILSYLAFIRFFPILPWSDTTLDSSTSH